MGLLHSPDAKVKAKMNASFNADGQLVAAPDKRPRPARLKPARTT
jgi:hypothetical protein